MPYLFIVSAIAIGFLGVMYITGWKLNKIVDPDDVPKEELERYMERWNAREVGRLIGVSLIVAAVYMVSGSIAYLIDVWLIFQIATGIFVLYALVAFVYFSVGKRFRGNGYEEIRRAKIEELKKQQAAEAEKTSKRRR